MVGAAYKNLDAAENVKYEALAKQDKKRYEREMSNYEPPEDSDDDSDDGKGKGKKGAKKKAKKDPNAPKVRFRSRCRVALLSFTHVRLTYYILRRQ